MDYKMKNGLDTMVEVCENTFEDWQQNFAKDHLDFHASILFVDFDTMFLPEKVKSKIICLQEQFSMMKKFKSKLI